MKNVAVLLFMLAVAALLIVALARIDVPDKEHPSQQTTTEEEDNYVPPVYVNIPGAGYVPIG